MQEVRSPVCLSSAAGPSPKIIGKYPLLTEKEALETLDAAVRAYDYGRGAWPTTSVEGRIKHVEEFAYRMKEQRSDVVNLLMWEIGKSLNESEKEFERTVEYILGTMNALKELDRGVFDPDAGCGKRKRAEQGNNIDHRAGAAIQFPVDRLHSVSRACPGCHS